MMDKAPHFLLFSESTERLGRRPHRVEAQDSIVRADGLLEPGPARGLPAAGSAAVPDPHANRQGAQQDEASCWHFVLRSEDGQTHLDVLEAERNASPERLELLAVVRGLEALDQPSRVTLVTASTAVRRGLRFGLEAWRENRWQWERFGRMAPIKNADLWRRIDRALEIHDIECRLLRAAPPADDLSGRSPAANGIRSSDGKYYRLDSPRRTEEGHAVAMHRRQRTNRATRWRRLLRSFFGWLGLCRSPASLVMAAP